MKNNKGITLISLVITIIVLLIISAISISMLSGNNSIINQANEAKTKTNNSQDREAINIEVLKSYKKDGSLDIDKLKSDLVNLGATPEGTTFPLSVSYNGNNYKIDADGTVRIDDGGDNPTPGGDNPIPSDGTWAEEEGVNTPKLAQGLIPVTFNNDGSVTEVSRDDYSDYYDYSNKQWANAITKDQNGKITGYWVWVPRYEYKVNSSTHSFTVKFIPVTQTTEDTGYDHIHPVFRDGSSTHYMNGEWDSELPGFWVAKFPAGYQQNTITDSNGTLSTTISNSGDTLVLSNKKYTFISTYGNLNVPIGTINTSTNMSLPVFNPLTYAYNWICVGDSYTLAQEVSKSSNFYGLNESTYSHILKNSEWGAITYLAESQYGRNGAEISINNYVTTWQEEPYREGVTGIYANGSEDWMTDILGNAWYTQKGQLGSSTGNITGIYDLNGCVGESVACYISNGSYYFNVNSGISNWVSKTANANGYQTLSTKYYTVYPYDANNDTDTGNWNKYNSLKSSTYGYGDAILETSTSGTGNNSWFNDGSTYFEADYPYMERGGGTGAGPASGIFFYEESPATGYEGIGFRVVLCP